MVAPEWEIKVRYQSIATWMVQIVVCGEICVSFQVKGQVHDYVVLPT